MEQALEGSPATAPDTGTVGVYLHLPYCERVCPYCDFAVLAARPLTEATESAYLGDLQAELALRQSDFRDRALATVYLGGGTPSLFRPASVAAILESVRAAFPRKATAPRGGPGGGEIETTLELNPSTTERAALPGFRAAGVNRLSIGIQSMNDVLLKRLGRAHRAETARATLRSARAAGFDNLSVDLIFGVPGQSLAELEADLEALLEWSPEHVSTYELTFEPDTPFGVALAEGKLKPSDEDLVVEMTLRIEERLAAAGLSRYEISSYARPGYAARHNARYWQRQPVLGLGMGAHSTEARSPGASLCRAPRESEGFASVARSRSGRPARRSPRRTGRSDGAG